MQLVTIQMRRIEARNGIFCLKLRNYGSKRYILDYQGMLIFSFVFLLYPIKG